MSIAKAMDTPRGARKSLPKTVAKKRAQRTALTIHDQIRQVIRDLQAADARTAADSLDTIAMRLWNWSQKP